MRHLMGKWIDVYASFIYFMLASISDSISYFSIRTRCLVSISLRFQFITFLFFPDAPHNSKQTFKLFCFLKASLNLEAWI